MANEFLYDVFVSYSHEDAATVRDLAERLRKDGLRVWIDERSIPPGAMIASEVAEALERSRVSLLCLSRSAFASKWVRFEWDTVLYRDPANDKKRFVPVRFDSAEIPEALGHYAYVDWRGTAEGAYVRLLEACRPPVEEPPGAAATETSESRAILSLGHTDRVLCVALSGDARRAVSGSWDKTVRVWDVETGRCLRTLEGHTDSVLGVALSGDARRAVSGSADNTVRVWDVETGRCLRTLEGHTDSVLGVALSGDARRAVSGSWDKTVRVWDVETGRCLRTLEGHTDSVWGVALSGDARRAVSGSWDKTVRVWDVETGRCLRTLEGHTDSVWGVALSGDARRAVSGSWDKTVRVWDVETGRCLRTLEGHTDRVLCVALSGDARRAVSGSDDKTVRVWDVETGRCLRTLEGHTDRVLCVALSGDARRAVSGSDDKTVRVWDVETGRCLRTLEGHTDRVLGVALSGDARRAVSGSDDKTVRVWDVETGRCLRTLEGHTASVWGVALSGDARRAVSGSDDKTVRVWDVETGRCLRTLEGHTASVWGVALSGDARRAVSGSADKTVRVWDVETGRCLRTLEGHTASVWGVALSGDARRAVSGSDDKTVRVWDVETGRCLRTLEGHTDRVLCVALSGDARRAVSGSDDKTVRVWDVETGRCLRTLEGHTASVWGVALSGDARRAVSGSADKTVRVWDVETGRCLRTLEGHTARVWSVSLSSDGRSVFSAAENGVARFWRVAPTEGAAQPSCGEEAQYTNAKVLLVGDTSVGKTGLAVRMCTGRFEPSISTDAHWATQLPLPVATQEEGEEREVWLWDFAGQSDYRLIHQLFMDQTSLAVLVFNPQSDDPFDGLGQWDRDIKRAARTRYRKLLVAGRVDRGGITVTRNSIEQFRKDRGFGGYLETSALTGEGCDNLREAIVRSIAWDELDRTTSPRVFKLLKDEIVRLRDEDAALLRLSELKQQLEMRLPGERFAMDKLKTVVGLLAGPGLVWQLEFGDFVLLRPELINSYAAAVIRKVRTHTDEIGCIPEEDVLAGNLEYRDMKRLPRAEEEVVLRAMHQTFVDHGLCLRERTDDGTLLIFPSYFKRERPELEGHPAVLVTYQFSGALEEIYATLVVRLLHTRAFEKDILWRFAADFKTLDGRQVGLKMVKKGEGAAELAVYCDPDVHEETKVLFIRYVHEHLTAKAEDVVRQRHYVCPHCKTSVESMKAVRERLERGQKDILCANCEKRVPLWDLIEEKFASAEFKAQVRELEELAKARMDNESKELILVGHAFAIAGEAGQIYRPVVNSDWGIDGEMEFKDYEGKASGERLYIQLKSGDSYLYRRERDDVEIFTIKNDRHAQYWQQQAYPVMLVIRTSDGKIRWMDVSEYLKRESEGGKKAVRQIVFEGEPLTAASLLRMREKVLGPPR